jgi:hypothetical protein
MSTPPPDFCRLADRALSAACRRVTTITSATPRNFGSELERVSDAWARGYAVAPDLVHAPPPDLSDVMGELEALAERVEQEGPLGALYADRARELVLEARIAGSVGTSACTELARRRYAAPDELERDATELARSWVGASNASEPADVRSDDPDDPRSLLCRVRAGVGELRLAVRVVVVKNLAPLAAVGQGVIQIAEGRRITARDAERTALHELEGHLLPQARAAREPLGLFGVGTRAGSDDQEGRALTLEERRGFLVGARRAELARRHLAARAVFDGAEIVETIRLLSELGAPAEQAVRLALRAHRGGADGRGGIGREIVYLPALLRVRRELARAPGSEDILARGRVSVDAIAALRPYVGSTADGGRSTQ